jgi:hypothetical protein
MMTATTTMVTMMKMIKRLMAVGEDDADDDIGG